MKKGIVFLLSISVLVIFPLSVSAENGVDLNAAYYQADNGNVIVRADVVNIKDTSGLCSVYYDIEYDASKLEFVSADVNMPAIWEQFVSSGMAEDLSEVTSDGGYRWWIMYAGEGYGVTDDGEFSITLEFKPLSEDEAEISYKYNSIYSDKLQEVKGESKTLTLNLSDTPDFEEFSETIKNGLDTDNKADGTSNTEINADISDVNSDSKISVSGVVITAVVVPAIVLIGIVVVVVLVASKSKKGKK